MLYIVATPIGNLKDITFRALEVLKAVDYILCEDTRVSRILLNHYDIKTPLKSYHKFNEKKFLESILTDLKNFKEIALISDAGTPIISDPGNILVKEAIKNNLKITTIPGANSVISALTLSDMDTLPFQFLGFFKDEFLNRIIFYDGISIFFESSKKILKTIEKIKKIDPERNISIFKELTKKFETRIYKKAKDLHEYLLKNPLKGELTILVDRGEINNDIEIEIEECILLLQRYFGLDLKEAMKKCALIKKISKKEVYNKIKKSNP